jgi:hypothetical protein
MEYTRFMNVHILILSLFKELLRNSNPGLILFTTSTIMLWLVVVGGEAAVTRQTDRRSTRPASILSWDAWESVLSALVSMTPQYISRIELGLEASESSDDKGDISFSQFFL